MKPSHLSTPRTMSECTFTTGYTSAYRPTEYQWQDRLVIWAGAAAMAALAVVIVIWG